MTNSRRIIRAVHPSFAIFAGMVMSFPHRTQRLSIVEIETLILQLGQVNGYSYLSLDIVPIFRFHCLMWHS